MNYNFAFRSFMYHPLPLTFQYTAVAKCFVLIQNLKNLELPNNDNDWFCDNAFFCHSVLRHGIYRNINSLFMKMCFYFYRFWIKHGMTNDWIATPTSRLAMTTWSFKTLRYCVSLLLFLAFKGFNILNKNEAFADCSVT